MKLLTSRALIQQSTVQFGTSGARGLVLEFKPELCCAYTCAFIQLLRQSAAVGRIALAIDHRPSSYTIAAWCAAAAQQYDVQVSYYGVLPTPALAYAAMQQGIPAMMVTGSHIPFDRNGLKFYRAQGEITKQDEEQILAETAVFYRPASPAELSLDPFAAELYQQRYLDWFPADLAKGLTIGLYEHSSAGRDLYASLLERFGATVVRLGRSEHFVAIDTEAVSDEDQARAGHWTRQYQLDLLFSTDGDGDRPLVADEKGRWLRGDVLCLLAAKALNIEAVAVPVNCNTAIELSGCFQRVLRTRIGSPYVIAGVAQLRNYDAVAGFEANGGFILVSNLAAPERFLAALPTRDAVLPVLALIELAKGRPVSEFVSAVPRRFTFSNRLNQVATTVSEQLLCAVRADLSGFVASLGLKAEVVAVDTTDGLRLSLSNGDIVHLRPSGNAPELRCYAESASEQQARQLVADVLAHLL